MSTIGSPHSWTLLVNNLKYPRQEFLSILHRDLNFLLPQIQLKTKTLVSIWMTIVHQHLSNAFINARAQYKKKYTLYLFLKSILYKILFQWQCIKIY